MTNPNINYHPIIGVVVLALVVFQPLLGYLHHRQYKRTQTRTTVSHLHLWNGRVLLVLGIINGGLGLAVAGAPSTAKLAYTIVAAVMGGAWLLVTVVAGWRQARGGRDVFGREATREYRWWERRRDSMRMERMDKDGIGGDGYGEHRARPYAAYG